MNGNVVVGASTPIAALPLATGVVPLASAAPGSHNFAAAPSILGVSPGAASGLQQTLLQTLPLLGPNSLGATANSIVLDPVKLQALLAKKETQNTSIANFLRGRSSATD